MPTPHRDDTSLLSLLRDYIRYDEADRRFADMERRMNEFEERVGEDMTEIKKDVKEIKDVRLKNLEDALITNQKEGLQRIIRIQAFILSPIALAVIGYLIKLIFNS